MDPDQDLLHKLDLQEAIFQLLPTAGAALVAAFLAVLCYLTLNDAISPESRIAFDASVLVFLAASGLMALGVRRLR